MKKKSPKKKIVISILAVLIVVVASISFGVGDLYLSGTWRYKMTVEIETPEGIKTGSSVREMGNSASSSFIPEVGNPADVRGEAVVLDLGARGVLFALISHKSDHEFYDTFPVPSGKGGATPEGIKYYASLPVGTKGIVNPGMPGGYPNLVTFKDVNDPKSVTLVQEWERTRGQSLGHQFKLKNDRMEEFFGEGVKLKKITIEITDEPVTWGVVKKYLGQRHAVGPYEFVKGKTK